LTAVAAKKVAARVVDNVVEKGLLPVRLLVGVETYRALFAACDELQPRSIGRVVADTVRVQIDGFDLPVDCDASAGPGSVGVRFINMRKGRA
jgi:hypothetical protein